MVSWWCVIGEVHGGQGDVTICNQHMPMGYQQARSAAVEKGGIAHWIFMWVPRYFLHFRWTSCLGGLDSACIGFKASPRRMIMDTVDGCKILHHQKDGSTPINNGINHLSTGAGFRAIHRMFLATCHEISFLHLNAGGLWVHGDGVGVAGRQAMPCNLSTQKRTNRVEDFVEEDFVEFMLSLLWLALGWLSDLGQPFKFADLGNHGFPFGFLRDFPLISTKGPSSAPGSA